MTVEKGGEFRGKTVEAAINNGLAALGLSREQVEVEIVRPGSRGLLGIGAEDAVVHLTVVVAAQTQPAPKAAKTDSAPASKPEPSLRVEPAPKPAPKAEPAPKTDAKSAPKPKSAAPAAAQVTPAKVTGDVQDAESVERGRQLLISLLEHMDVHAQVEIVPQSEVESEDDERAMVLNIVGDDLGILIGRQNETLTSLQFITRLMVNQQTHSRSNLVVDVNGYKAKRAESLRKLALRTAEQVIQTGRTMALEPMSPADRRIIHLTLRNHQTVTTQSVGEGNRRKVTVLLKKQ